MAANTRKSAAPFVNDGYVTIGYVCPECGETVHKCLKWSVICNLVGGASVVIKCQRCGKGVMFKGLEVRDVH